MIINSPAGKEDIKKDEHQLPSVCTYINGWHFKRNKRLIQCKNVVKVHIRNNHRTILDYTEFCKQVVEKGH